MDAQGGYVVNEEYGPRSQRRKIEQMKSTKETVKGVVKRTKAVGSINHDDRKYLQQMVGGQVLEQSSKYSFPDIKRLPAELSKEATVKNMKKKGTLMRNKALAKRKAKMATENLNDPQGGEDTPTSKEYQEMANDLKIDKDETFSEITVEELNGQEDLNKLANYNFWDTQMRVRDGFIVQVKLGLPHFLEIICTGKKRFK